MNSAASTPKPLDFASKKRAYSRLISSLALVFAIVLGVPSGSLGGPASCPAAAKIFTNFQPSTSENTVSEIPFLSADGPKRSLKDYRGNGVVLNFWATWCAPCVREMPQLDRLSALVKDNSIEVLTVSEDRNGLVLAPKFYEKHKLNDLPVLVDEKSKLLRAFKVKGLPTTILISADGKEVGRVLGVAEWDSEPVVDLIRNCLRPKR